MKHYLITRFNLRVPEWKNHDKNGVPTLTSEWLEHRWKLFHKHTMPSVLAQTCQDFEWLVLFNIATRVGDAHFTPLFLTSKWLRELQQYLADQEESWIITTRLDNDDAIDPEFIQTIQDAARPVEEFLNIPNGIVKRGRKLTPLHHQANPFMSFVEPGDAPRSIYFTPHGQGMRKYAPIKQLVTKRLWTQVIHERNYING